MIANQLPYDVVYNQTCNRNHSIAVQPQLLDPLILHAKYIRRGWYWPNNGKSFPDSFYTGSPSYTTYLQLIVNGVVSRSGDVFTNDIQFIPYDTAPISNERPTLPGNLETISKSDAVFVMTQWLGVLGSIYHTMVEDIPRLALYVEFLRKHPHIVIASSEPFRERVNEILKNTRIRYKATGQWMVSSQVRLFTTTSDAFLLKCSRNSSVDIITNILTRISLYIRETK